MDYQLLSRRTGGCRCQPPPAAGIALYIFSILVLCFLIFVTVKNPLMHDAQDMKRLQIVEKAVSSLEGAVDYLLLFVNDVDLDVIFKARIMEGQLLTFNHHFVLQDNFRKKRHLFSHLLPRLAKLRDKAHRLQQEFIDAVGDKKPSFYETLQPKLSAGVWNLWHAARDINQRDNLTYGFEEKANEDLRDDRTNLCLKESYEKQCQFTENCWTRTAESSFNGHLLTHEILLILNAFVLGCKNELESSSQIWKNMSADALLAKECTAVLYEAQLFAARNFPFSHMALFLEQTTFCGILGYRDFFRDEWLEGILKWQSKRGCFLRNQIELDECSVPMTANALTALGQYVRYLLESVS